MQAHYSLALVISLTSLMEVLHCDRKLYLVFEFLEYDLKKYMDKHVPPSGMPLEHVKVSECTCFKSANG